MPKASSKTKGSHGFDAKYEAPTTIAEQHGHMKVVQSSRNTEGI